MTIDEIADMVQAPVAGTIVDRPVLRLLAPLTATYARRVNPEDQPVGRHDPPVIVPPIGEHVWCVVEAVVVVDAKGRVAWRPGGDGQPTAVGSVSALGEGVVQVMLTDPPGNPVWPVDARGRLQLRHGVLQAAAIGPGDRVVIVGTADPRRILLTAATGLAVRHPAAG